MQLLLQLGEDVSLFQIDSVHINTANKKKMEEQSFRAASTTSSPFSPPSG